MMVFEDAISRWRHSRSCRSGGFDNFIRRREIETQALQKMAETLDPEIGMTHTALPASDTGTGPSKELCCFICHQRFLSLDEMREHVKYPCNRPSVLQRPSVTVYIEEPTFGTGIQQHYTEGPVSRQSTFKAVQSEPTDIENPHPVTVFLNDVEQGEPHGEAKPTNIYVNEKGETVIEVENLDLNTKSGELSLAHLLTQLSQQGIVFDQRPHVSAEQRCSDEETNIHDSIHEIDLSQPTAVDAANTLTQLAESAFRTSQPPQIYENCSPNKQMKIETVDDQYSLQKVEQIPFHNVVQDNSERKIPAGQNYIICAGESEVISVVQTGSLHHADNLSDNDIVSKVHTSADYVAPGCEESLHVVGTAAVCQTDIIVGEESSVVQESDHFQTPCRVETQQAHKSLTNYVEEPSSILNMQQEQSFQGFEGDINEVQHAQNEYQVMSGNHSSHLNGEKPMVSHQQEAVYFDKDDNRIDVAATSTVSENDNTCISSVPLYCHPDCV